MKKEFIEKFKTLDKLLENNQLKQQRGGILKN